MGLKTYLPLAVIAFIAATTGSDLAARIFIAGETFRYALSEHLHWASEQAVGTILLLWPFVTVALIGASVDKRARTRSAAPIFGVGLLTLSYFYFTGHQGAQHALLEEKWTAAALSIGLLPFVIGIPVVLAVAGAGAVAVRFDARRAN